MPVKISPLLNDQQFSANGVPLSGGKIETYLAGSSTLATTFTTIAGNVAQTNPIILNTRGEVDNLIWLDAGVSYKFILKDSANNVLRTYDNVSGVNDIVGTADQWVASGAAPTFVNTTQFTLAGDQTTIFERGRRIKLTVTGGTVYASIATSVFTTLTTVTVILDSGVLDSGLSVVQYGLVSQSNTSLPKASAFSAQASASQSVTTTTATKVTLSVENFDTNANFDPATSRHTPTVAGHYQYAGTLRGQATSLTTASVSLYKNGAAYRQGGTINTAATTASHHLVVGDLVFMNGTTDYMELFGLIIGTTPSFEFFSATQNCAFSGVLVRAA